MSNLFYSIRKQYRHLGDNLFNIFWYINDETSDVDNFNLWIFKNQQHSCRIPINS